MAAPKLRMTLEDYRAREASAEVRHELYDGDVYAMAGGTVTHSHVGTGFIRYLANGVDASGCGCVVLGPDMRVHVDEDTQCYPDAMVVCPPVVTPEGDRCSVANPVVIVEVMSPSSAAWDLSGKRERYARVASLRHYVVAHQDVWRVHHFQRLEDGAWRVTTLGPDDVLELEAVGARVRVEDVYRGVEQVGGPARDAEWRGPDDRPVRSG
jgi:Uma2 family endonuclease